MSDASDMAARLEVLIAATGFPPSNLEPDQILDAYQAIAAARAPLIAELALLAPTARADAHLTDRFDDLARRDRAWLEALGHAQTVVEQRIGAVRRARQAR
jgi:hypothetical protein